MGGQGYFLRWRNVAESGSRDSPRERRASGLRQVQTIRASAMALRPSPSPLARPVVSGLGGLPSTWRGHTSFVRCPHVPGNLSLREESPITVVSGDSYWDRTDLGVRGCTYRILVGRPLRIHRGRFCRRVAPRRSVPHNSTMSLSAVGNAQRIFVCWKKTKKNPWLATFSE